MLYCDNFRRTRDADAISGLLSRIVQQNQSGISRLRILVGNCGTRRHNGKLQHHGGTQTIFENFPHFLDGQIENDESQDTTELESIHLMIRQLKVGRLAAVRFVISTDSSSEVGVRFFYPIANE